jgi:glutamine---fructose-6-phosphate transaminase (isomerizing)
MINMNSISAMGKEIGYQVEDLPKLSLPKQTNVDECLIVGSGDSYVAALITQYVSDYRAACCTPMEVAINPKIVRNRRLYIVSVSGSTRSNILAAKKSRIQNVPTTAITARPESELAKNCDQIIEIHYRSTGIPTSGTISFTSSVLCCLSLVGKMDSLDRLKSIYSQTENEVEDILASEKDASCIFLAEGILFPVAIYAALKMNEVFGQRSFAYHFEEFCHSPMFSIKRDDKIVILGNGNKGYDNSHEKEFNKTLRKMGYNCIYLDCANNNNNNNKNNNHKIEQMSLTETLIKSIMIVQLYVVKLAERRRLKNCYFLDNKDLLSLSSAFIYDNNR